MFKQGPEFHLRLFEESKVEITRVDCTDNPLYTDTLYNDKIRYNDN